jgi:hypothetical protein
MTDGSAWKGNWKARLHERVRGLGFASLTAFAEARPTASLVALAEELGKDDVAGIHVCMGLLAEAQQRRQLARFERDMLVRELNKCIPNGWPAVLEDPYRFPVAKALGLWIGDIPEAHQERARKVADALLANPPPPGWLPLSPDDELLRALLPDEEA